MNEALIQDQNVEGKIRKELEQYFPLNETQEVSDATIWEVHKAYIRGILISIGTQKKMERSNKIRTLLSKLYELKQLHKKKTDLEVQHLLVLKREELHGLMEQEVFNRVAKDRYQWGNKPGKHLARILKKKNLQIV